VVGFIVLKTVRVDHLDPDGRAGIAKAAEIKRRADGKGLILNEALEKQRVAGSVFDLLIRCRDPVFPSVEIELHEEIGSAVFLKGVGDRAHKE